MQRWLGLTLAIVVAGALLAGGARRRRAQPPPPAAAPPSVALPAPPGPRALPDAVQPNAFFEAATFDKGLRAARAYPAPAATGVVVGGLVPHHTLAGSLFSTFFLGLEARPPATIVVVGPNHPNAGQRIITGRRGWATDFGVVAADQELIDALLATGLVTVDEKVLSAEHSVGAEMPYIKYHAPEARVVPLILHRDVQPVELRRLADVLAPRLGPDCLLLASVDFSHYLTRREADKKDPETLRAIEAHDLTTLWRMGPDHLDSPPALGLLLLTMQRLGLEQPEILARGNSGLILGSESIETTSYFVFRYQKL